MLQIQFALLSGIFFSFFRCCSPFIFVLSSSRCMSQADETLNCSSAAKVCWLTYTLTHPPHTHARIRVFAVYSSGPGCVGVRTMCCLLVTMDTYAEPPSHRVISILMCGIFAFFPLYYPYLNIFVIVHHYSVYTEPTYLRLAMLHRK